MIDSFFFVCCCFHGPCMTKSPKIKIILGRIQNILINMDSATQNPADTQVDVTINRTTRFIHFSDGVEEEIEEDVVKELQSKPSGDDNVDTTSLPWGPWFSHYAWKSGTKVLNAVDYAGESLAGFFGITTPKYAIEVEEFERMQEDKKKLEDEAAGWVPKNVGGDVPLVLQEPGKDIDRANV